MAITTTAQASPEITQGSEKNASDEKNITALPDEAGDESDKSSQIKQDGVKQIEAVTQTWSTTMLWLTFALLYLVTFVDTLLQSVHGSLLPYVTSSFSQHGLIPVTNIFASVIGGVGKLAIAKIIDIRGRCEGFLLMILLILVGMIMKALCKNVETYAAGHTFYWVGHIGLGYIVQVILSDMTTLRNRMIMWGIYMSPRIAATFGGPKIAELFYKHSTYRWAFGVFCIILIGFSVPVAVILIYNERKARKIGIIREKSSRTFWESTKYYFIEFDVIGMLLTIAGFSLILLPLNIATRAPNGWATDYIIAMIVVGVVSLFGFAAWEKWYAKVPYIPFHFLKNRSILGACFLNGFEFMSVFCWDTYYGSYLQVVHGLSISTAGYALNAYSLTSTVIAPFIGLGLRYYERYFWPAVGGIPFSILGTALLVHFRQPGEKLGYLVMCQVFHGISGGLWAMTVPLALMVEVNHQEIAVVIALSGMFSSIGQAVGFGISGAIWNNDLPRELNKALPDDAKNRSALIFGNIVEQMADPIGTPVRDAVIKAYGIVQRQMVIAGCAFLPFMIISIFMWHNRKLDRKQVKGNVF